MTRKPHCHRAFTLIELVLVLFILAVLAAALLPKLTRNARLSRLSTCQNNLKQVGLAHVLWVGDHAEKNYLPGEISTNHGGTLEYLRGAELFRHFQLFTNELGSPAVLVCPADDRKPGKSLGALENLNLSYFVNGGIGPLIKTGNQEPIDAPLNPVILGDRNVTNIFGPPQILRVTKQMEQSRIGWNSQMHNKGRKGSEALVGNAAFLDGSAKNLTTAELQEAFKYDTSTGLVLP